MTELTTQERFKRGAADAGRYFEFMAAFVDFRPDYTEAIRATRFIVEKYIPGIVADFYVHLLSFPATRKHFLKRDGTIDQDYLTLRMQHQTTFWRRTAQAEFDEDYARFVDYVGRAHTSHGADASVYIPERYVMGMVGFVQQRLVEALTTELHTIDPDLEVRAIKGWNSLLIVLLELLTRPYGPGQEAETFQPAEDYDEEPVHQLAIETYERSLGIARSVEYRRVYVGRADEIPEGARKIVQAEGLSIGVFHHGGQWMALHNSCLHRGGPVCEGDLTGDTLTCPWHGYQYNVQTGRLLLDPSAKLPSYPVEVQDGEVYLQIPVLVRDPVDISLADLFHKAEAPRTLAANEFRLADLKPGEAKKLDLDGQPVAVYNVDGSFYATHDKCTHVGGPLSEGKLEGVKIICPWHASCFDVTNGDVLCGPAKVAVRTYKIVIDAEVGRVVAA